ncbi:MAG TPA: glycosyltransferase family 4 protein, partial [Mycobacteriales bacterium]|nr:glycosyltransferase family 4 protein [Mycobacteriales bacterium]
VVHDVRGRALAERAVSASRRSERWSARLAAPRVAAAEARWLSSCDVAWAFAADPLLETVAPRLGVRLVPPWLELPAAPPGPQPGGPVLFVAAFDRVENVEAARWLVRSVWPAVRGAHAGARLVLAGAHPERVADLAGSDVTLTGYLAELGPLYASAAAVVAPVRGAGGLPFKVPQAMAWALPVVATTLGADPVTADRTLFAAVADDPADFAAGILATLADPARGRAVGAAAQAWVRAAYDLDAALDAAAALYRDLAAGN